MGTFINFFFAKEPTTKMDHFNLRIINTLLSRYDRQTRNVADFGSSVYFSFNYLQNRLQVSSCERERWFLFWNCCQNAFHLMQKVIFWSNLAMKPFSSLSIFVMVASGTPFSCENILVMIAWAWLVITDAEREWGRVIESERIDTGSFRCTLY